MNPLIFLVAALLLGGGVSAAFVADKKADEARMIQPAAEVREAEAQQMPAMEPKVEDGNAMGAVEDNSGPSSDNQQQNAVPQTNRNAAGVKLRGNGTVDDNSNDRNASGVKLRGDGTVDDNGNDSNKSGVKRRGDGSIDDNSNSSGGNKEDRGGSGKSGKSGSGDGNEKD